MELELGDRGKGLIAVGALLSAENIKSALASFVYNFSTEDDLN